MTQPIDVISPYQFRKIQNGDPALLSDYYLRNSDHFKIWEPKRTSDAHSRENWETKIIELIEHQNEGTAAYFVAHQGTRIVAHCTLSQIVYGAFRACYMGYAVSSEHEGKGLAYALCQNVLCYAFNELKLNRVMANYMPHNSRSERLLQRLGFVREGFARNYLHINGKWENHVLTAKYRCS